MAQHLQSKVLLAWPLAFLSSRRPCFEVLNDRVPTHQARRHWNYRDGEIHLINVVVLGKSGYGKSSLLNQLIGVRAFETSDITACTTTIQSAIFQMRIAAIPTYLAFTDLPGIGESLEQDMIYHGMYEAILPQAHCVVYMLRADQRDFTIDLEAFRKVKSSVSSDESVIIALNAIDKIDPLSRDTPFRLEGERAVNLSRKIDSIVHIFGVSRSQILPLSATDGFGIDAFEQSICDRLTRHLESV